MIELACGPISGSAVREEIPLICSLFLGGSGTRIRVMYGFGCRAEDEDLWRPRDIVTATLPDWIESSIQRGVYLPGESDVFIFDEDRLVARLCHEADIHIETRSAAIVGNCASRWLAKRYRLLRSDVVPPTRESWREVSSAEEAAAGL